MQDLTREGCQHFYYFAAWFALYGGSAPSFLRTHPLTSERISDVENRVVNMPYRQVVSSLDYYFVRAKLRANNGLAQTVVDQFQHNIKTGRYANEVAEHYGLAVAMLRKMMQQVQVSRLNGWIIVRLKVRL